MDPLGFVVATQLTREHVGSAMPKAPIRHDRRRSKGALRSRTANALHRLANAIQPRTEPAPPARTCTPIGA